MGDDWTRLLAGDDLAGWTPAGARWSREADEAAAVLGDDGAHGAGAATAEDWNAGGRLVTGDPTWRDQEVACGITPLAGALAQLHLRIAPDERRWYTLDLRLDQGRITLSRADNRPGGRGLIELEGRRAPLALGREHQVVVRVEGATLTATVDGLRLGPVTDTWLDAGPVALAVWRCRARFRDPRVRRLA